MLYEMLYIMSTSLNEADSERLAKEMSDTITNTGGKINKESNWGTRKLSYEIKKQTDGVYYYLEFDAPTNIPTVLNELVHTRTGILRHFVLQIPKAKLLQEKRDAEKRQRELDAAQKEKEEALAAEALAQAKREEEEAAKKKAEEEAKTEDASPETPPETVATEATPATEAAPATETPTPVVAEAPATTDAPKKED